MGNQIWMTSPLLNDWANHMHAEGRANRTVRERMILLAKLERDLGTPALAATREQLRDWLASPEIGQSTRSVYHSNINAFYLWAVDQELRDDNPLAKIKPARRPKRKPRPIAVADYERARDAAGLEMRAMLMLITLAGLRDAEIARFQSRHIDISGEIIEVTGKGGNTEIVDAHPDLLFIARRMPRGYWFPSSHPGHRHIGGGRCGNECGCIFCRAVCSVPRISCATRSGRSWCGAALIYEWCRG